MLADGLRPQGNARQKEEDEEDDDEDEEEEEEEEEFKPPAPMSVLDLMKALQAAKEALTAFHPEIINGELKKVTRSGRYY